MGIIENLYEEKVNENLVDRTITFDKKSDIKIVELMYKMASINKGVLVSENEFKKSQVSKDFKLILDLMISSINNNDITYIKEILSKLDSKYEEINSSDFKNDTNKIQEVNSGLKEDKQDTSKDNEVIEDSVKKVEKQVKDSIDTTLKSVNKRPIKKVIKKGKK